MKKIKVILAFLLMLSYAVVVRAAEPMSVNIVIEDAIEAEKNSTPITMPTTDSKVEESISIPPVLPETPPVSDAKTTVVDETKKIPKIEAEVPKTVNKPVIIPVQIPRPTPAKIKGVDVPEESVVETVSVDSSKGSNSSDVSDKSTDTKPKTEEKKQQVNIVNGRPSPAVIKVK